MFEWYFLNADGLQWARLILSGAECYSHPPSSILLQAIEMLSYIIKFSFKSNLFLKVIKIQIDLKFKVQWRHLKINLIIIYYLI